MVMSKKFEEAYDSLDIDSEIADGPDGTPIEIHYIVGKRELKAAYEEDLEDLREQIVALREQQASSTPPDAKADDYLVRTGVPIVKEMTEHLQTLKKASRHTMSIVQLATIDSLVAFASSWMKEAEDPPTPGARLSGDRFLG